MDDSGDVFATPIAKLPPPPIQTGPSGHPGGGAGMSDTTYNPDLFKQLEAERTQQQQFQQQNMQSFPETPMNGNNYYQSPAPPQQFQSHQPSHQQPQQMPIQNYYTPPSQGPPSLSDDHANSKKKKKRPTTLLSLDTLKRKQLWIVAIVMFLVVVYVMPRMRGFSALVNPTTGQLSTPAVAAVCVASGLLASAAGDSL